MGGSSYLIVIVAYLFLMGGMGVYFARRRVRTGDEFMLAGRSLPLWVMMGTLLATWVGSGTIVGGAAFTYQRGPLATIFFHAGVPIGIVILYFFLAERVRSLSKTMRRSDLWGRYTRDKLGLLLTDTNEAAARRVLKRMAHHMPEQKKASPSPVWARPPQRSACSGARIEPTPSIPWAIWALLIWFTL